MIDKAAYSHKKNGKTLQVKTEGLFSISALVNKRTKG